MITIQQQTKLEEYAQLKVQAKGLESRMEELNKEVLEIMQNAKVEEITVNTLGRLMISGRRKWTYSLDVQSAEKFLKDKKKEEERLGKAQYTENKFVVFRTPEENQDEKNN